MNTEWMRKLRARAIAWWVAVALPLFTTPAVRADHVPLDQSNTQPDGIVSDGSVQIE